MLACHIGVQSFPYQSPPDYARVLITESASEHAARETEFVRVGAYTPEAGRSSEIRAGTLTLSSTCPQVVTAPITPSSPFLWLP